MASAIDQFLALGCLAYDVADDPARWVQARQMWEAQPELALDLAVALVLSHSHTVRRLLEQDPGAARRPCGPHRWPPLLYLAYGRVQAPRQGESAAAAMQCLLQAGADPDAGFWSGDQYWFSAITGVLGEGEQGPYRQPPHPESAALLDLLLAAGARPDDGQSLYNRMFSGRWDHLGPMLDHGLRVDARANWRTHAGGPQVETPILGMLLDWDADHGHTERAAMLLQAGVTANQRPDGTPSPWRRAVLGGHRDLAVLLEAHGAPREPLADGELLRAAVLAADRTAAQALLLAQPDLLARTLRSHGDLLERAALHPVGTSALRLALQLGVPPDHRAVGVPALHSAAAANRLDSIRVLLDAGADPSAKDGRFGATPSGWAEHHGHIEAARLLTDGRRSKVR